jgi:hypothetical protein
MENYTRNNNNAGWEAQMIYAQRERERVLREQQANTVEKPVAKNYNQQPSHKKLMKNLAKVALVASLAGGLKITHDQIENNTTVNDSVREVKDLQDTSTDHLDTEPDQIENYELISDTNSDERDIVELEPGDAIRTNDEDYTDSYNFEFNPKHNALAQNTGDDSKFFSVEGPVYKTPNGRIAVLNENLKETIDGEKTGIKFELDDKYSVIDVSPDDIKMAPSPTNPLPPER